MTARFRCLACFGEYSDKCPDGSVYFHACPPLDIDQAGLVFQEAINKRDENPVADSGGAARPRLEGLGRVRL